ncbi:tetratricopeptide repeat protein [Spirosoma sp. BT702]|uniref:Tetratricopeptide repeat protein n=1 Tax=Spirosoma profusum TaxID=2771354 RepID=A0A926XZJ3_9BACT|nr:tetratricopeptide repeat protein [Spirosoma profusum]MBD2701117.1 tetratricopeptide repeat protein [Spirosoma profusum]
MNKSVLFVIILAAALTVGLYSLPKVVVRNENKQLSEHTTSNASSQHRTGAGKEAAPAESSAGAAMHEKPLSAAQQDRLSALRAQFFSASVAEKAASSEKIIAFFREVTRYDSAAYYAELLATDQPTEQHLLRAGDHYFEAFTFAMDDKKTASLGQKTRDFYQQALAKNPNLLSAKANMAMTYVNTDTPMQGIMLLREVIKQDPTNELALFNLGLLSMRSNQYERAIERFRQILVSNPASRKAQFYLGISLAEAGQKAEARQVLEQVKKQEKDPQILAAIREYEERLKN